MPSKHAFEAARDIYCEQFGVQAAAYNFHVKHPWVSIVQESMDAYADEKYATLALASQEAAGTLRAISAAYSEKPGARPVLAKTATNAEKNLSAALEEVRKEKK